MLGAAAPSRPLGPAFHAGGGCPGIGLVHLRNFQLSFGLI